MAKKQYDDTKPVTEKVLQKTLVNALAEFWEQVIYPELNKRPTKKSLEVKFSQIRSEEKNTQRLVRDLQLDSPTRKEFDKLERRVTALEYQ